MSTITPGDAGAFSGAEGLSVEHQWMVELLVVVACGEVDALTAPELTAAIDVALATGISSPTGLIVDLSGVDFLASAGLGVLISTHDAVTPTARFAVVANGAAARSITVLGLDTVITLHRTLQDAVRDLDGG